ncbi:MAG: SCO family protein [Bacteroidetes bacterium]|nr:SCO family protein [Bacteroidota bacterium]
MNKKIVTLFLLIGFFNFCFAQETIDKKNEIGVTEHLGKNIPLDLKFARETGDSVTLKQIVNKPTIVIFVYFDCTSLCIPLMQGVCQVVKQTDLKLGKDYQIVTISLDPADTPDKAFRSKASITQSLSKEQKDGWIYLTSSDSTIQKMIHSVGYNIKAVGMEFIHPAAIVIVSPKGKITRYLYGMTYLPFDIKMAISEANKELSRPTIQKILLYCFSYDPDGKRYTLEVTRVAGTIIVFILIIFFIVLIVKRKKNKNGK